MHHFGDVYERKRHAATPRGTLCYEEVIDIRGRDGIRIGELCRPVGGITWAMYDVTDHYRGAFDTVVDAESALERNPAMIRRGPWR